MPSVSYEEIRQLFSPVLSAVRELRSEVRTIVNQGMQIMTTQTDIINALQRSHDNAVKASTIIQQQQQTITNQNSQLASLQAKLEAMSATASTELDPNSLQPQLDALANADTSLEALLSGGNQAPDSASGSAQAQTASGADATTSGSPASTETPPAAPVGSGTLPDTVAGALAGDGTNNVVVSGTAAADTSGTSAATVTGATPSPSPDTGSGSGS